MRPLVWFRSDLRTRDNTALATAARAADSGVVGVFVISPGEWRAHDVAPARVDLMLRTLRVLSEDLARLNIPLLIARADRGAEVPRILLDLARTHRCDALHFNREYEVDESRRDGAVTRSFERAGIAVRAHTDQVVIAPGEVLTGAGGPFTVFTPFRRAWIKVLESRGDDGARVMPAPCRQESTGVRPGSVPRAVEGFESRVDPALWPAGEGEALRRLARFRKTGIARYAADRDAPALDGTSTLSPYLTIGAISPRQCLAVAIDANAARAAKHPFDRGSKGVVTWISELIWREFYVHVLAAFPRVCMGRAFKTETDRLPWSYDERLLAAWREGRTGVPIVDAAMRQLAATGWMHNRCRMITAMYLAKDLFIDWRLGERHFMRSLVDGFFASNNGGWQWSASTGTDAAPYFRIFNPASQSRRFDPDGAYIRRWVPELAGVRGDAVHDPHGDKRGLPATNLARPGYPRPIVDHAEARGRVIAAFRGLASLQTPPRRSRRAGRTPSTPRASTGRPR